MKERRYAIVHQSSFPLSHVVWFAIGAGYPKHVKFAVVVRTSREYEEEVRESIEIDHNLRVDPLDRYQAQHFDLRATTDGSCDVQLSRGARSSGKNETRQGLKLFVCEIDPVFELNNLIGRNSQRNVFEWLV